MNDEAIVTMVSILGVLALLAFLVFAGKSCDESRATGRQNFLVECVKTHTPLECKASWNVQWPNNLP